MCHETNPPHDSSKPLRWGLLSTARINRSLIPPLRESARNEVVAVASRTLERAKSYNEQWQIPHIYGSYEALLADPTIDVVYISLPNSLHAEWVIKAVQARKHVLCEKPLGLNVEEVDRMVAAAEDAGVVLAEAMMYRHHHQTLKVKELIEDGVIGQLHLIRGVFSYQFQRGNEDIRFNASLGGGSLWDIGCYPISYANFVVGSPPEEVIGWQVSGETEVDLAFVGQMRYPREIFAQFNCGFLQPSRSPMEFVGSQGVLSIPRAFKLNASDHILFSDDHKTEKIPVDTSVHRYAGEVEDMSDAILLKHPLRVSIAEIRSNIATIDALLHSASKGKPVVL